jgi:5-methyltetrahydropteroyltriglutamate--homocysteine methyltransferase
MYRAEVVGSLVRPEALVEARGEFRAGRLGPQEYRQVEDAAVDDALRLQQQVGVDVATDGEMRRNIFFEFFVTGLDGLSPLPGWTVEFHGTTPEDAMSVTIPFTVTP